MSKQDSQIGSTDGSYWEYVNRSGADSPRSNAKGARKVYNQWNPYTWTRRLYLGGVVRCSRNPPGPYFQPSYSDSNWNIGDKFAPQVISDPSGITLLSKLVQEWKNTDANVGVSIAEGKESFGMVYEKLLGLYQASRALRKGNLGGAINHFTHPVPRKHVKRAAKRLSQGDISGSWLALNLGWAPMIQDIYAGLEYADSEGGYGIIRTPWVKGSITCNSAGGNSNLVHKKKDYRSRLVCEIRTPPVWYDRLGLTNPALVAWELVPFSFVVDYFLPIGDSIEALTALRIDKGRVMRQDRIHVTAKNPSLPKGSMITPGIWAYDAKRETRHSYRFYRRTLTSVLDQMVFKGASLSIPSSLKRIANMSALLHQQLLGMRRK